MKKNETEKEKTSFIKSVIDLANKGYLKESQQLMSSKVTEQEFLENLTPTKINSKVLSFVQTFKNPDWNLLAEKIHGKFALEFIHFANKNNIDIFEPKPPQNSIFVKVFSRANIQERQALLNTLDDKNLVKVFMEEDFKIDLLLKSFINGSIEEETVKSVLNKLTNSEFINSDKYIKLFTERNEFTDYLVGEIDFNTLKYNLEGYKDFFKDNDKSLMDTHVIKILISSRDLYKNENEYLQNVIQDKSLNPQLDLLKPVEKEQYLNGNMKVDINSYQYKIFKSLLTNGLMNLDTLNKPQAVNSTYSVFERFLINNLKTDNYYNNRSNEKDLIERVNVIIKEAKELLDLGIEKTCSVWKTTDITELLDRQFKYLEREKRHSVHDDAYIISNELHINPKLISRLLEILDKRYNYKPTEEHNLDNDEKTKLKESWNELMNGLVFTKEIPPVVEEKKKIKP